MRSYISYNRLFQGKYHDKYIIVGEGVKNSKPNEKPEINNKKNTPKPKSKAKLMSFNTLYLYLWKNPNSSADQLQAPLLIQTLAQTHLCIVSHKP